MKIVYLGDLVGRSGRKIVAEKLAKKAVEKKITKIYFDRGVYKYHGRVKALADAARENGLEF